MIIKFMAKLLNSLVKMLEWFGFFNVKVLKHNSQVMKCVWSAWKRTMVTDYEIDKKFYKARKKVFWHLWESDKKTFIKFIKNFFKRAINFFMKIVMNLIHMWLYSIMFIIMYLLMFIIQMPLIMMSGIWMMILKVAMMILKVAMIMYELLKKINKFFSKMLNFFNVLKKSVKQFPQKVMAMWEKLKQLIVNVKSLPQFLSSFFSKGVKTIQTGTENLEKSMKKLPNSVENFMVMFEKVNYNWILTVMFFLEFFFGSFLLSFLQVFLHKIWWSILYVFLYVFHGMRMMFMVLCFQVYMLVLMRFPSFSFVEAYGEMKAYNKYPWVKRWFKKNSLIGKLELFFYFIIYLLNGSSYKDKQELIFSGYMKKFEKSNKFVFMKKMFARFSSVIWKSCIFFRFFIYAILEPFLKIFVMFVCYCLLLFFFIMSFFLYMIFFKQHFFVLLSPVHWYGRWGFQKTYKPLLKTLKKLYIGWCYFTCQFYSDIFSPSIDTFLQVWCVTTCSVFWETVLYCMSSVGWFHAFLCFFIPPFIYGMLLLLVFFSKKVLLSMSMTMIERSGGMSIGPRTDFRNYVKELDKSPKLYEIVDEMSLSFMPLLVSCEMNFLSKFVLAVNRFFTVHTFLDLINIFENFFIKPVGHILHPQFYNFVFQLEWDGFEWMKTKTFELIQYTRILIKSVSMKKEDKKWEMAENSSKYIDQMMKNMKMGGDMELETLCSEHYWKEYKEMSDIPHNDILYSKGLSYKPYSEFSIQWNLFKSKMVTGLSIIMWFFFTVPSLMPLLWLPFEWCKNIYNYLCLRKKFFFVKLSQYFEFKNPLIHTNWGVILSTFFEGEANNEDTQSARKFLVSRINLKSFVEYLITFKIFSWLIKFKYIDKLYWIMEKILKLLSFFYQKLPKSSRKILKFLFFIFILLLCIWLGIFYQSFSLNNMWDLQELYDNIMDDTLKESMEYYLHNNENSLGGWEVLFPLFNNISGFSLHTFFSGDAYIYDYAFPGEEEVLKSFWQDIKMEAFMIYIFNCIILSGLFIYQVYFWQAILVLLGVCGWIFWSVNNKASKILDLLKKVFMMLKKFNMWKKKKEKKKK